MSAQREVPQEAPSGGTAKGLRWALAIAGIALMIVVGIVVFQVGGGGDGGEDGGVVIAPTTTAPATPPTAPTSPTPAPRTATPTPREPPAAPSPTPTPTQRPTQTPTEPRPDQTPTLPAALIGTEWERLPTGRRVVALTFDAGANADGLPAILRTLETEGVPATFFLTGTWIERHPDQARIVASRYPVGNHTFTHPDLTALSEAEIIDEINRTATAIRATSAPDPRPLFRFPFGARDDRTIRVVNDAGYGSIRWTVDTLGWKGTSGGMDSATIIERVLDTLGPGQIVLLHVGSNPDDGSMLDADALPEIITRIRAAGYSFITIRDAIAALP